MAAGGYRNFTAFTTNSVLQLILNALWYLLCTDGVLKFLSTTVPFYICRLVTALSPPVHSPSQIWQVEGDIGAVPPSPRQTSSPSATSSKGSADIMLPPTHNSSPLIDNCSAVVEPTVVLTKVSVLGLDTKYLQRSPRIRVRIYRGALPLYCR